jgi:hypothetical protein
VARSAGPTLSYPPAAYRPDIRSSHSGVIVKYDSIIIASEILRSISHPLATGRWGRRMKNSNHSRPDRAKNPKLGMFPHAPYCSRYPRHRGKQIMRCYPPPYVKWKWSAAYRGMLWLGFSRFGSIHEPSCNWSHNERFKLPSLVRQISVFWWVCGAQTQNQVCFTTHHIVPVTLTASFCSVGKRRLFVCSNASTSNASDHLDLRERIGHRLMPRLVPRPSG